MGNSVITELKVELTTSFIFAGFVKVQHTKMALGCRSGDLPRPAADYLAESESTLPDTFSFRTPTLCHPTFFSRNAYGILHVLFGMTTISNLQTVRVPSEVRQPV